MKTLIALIILSLSISCKEEEKNGLCTACCDANGDKICKPNFTNKMCADYNKDRVDGHEWIFIETVLPCLPPGPN